jgi:GntR family transcriptional regulator, vanillate catabolism transcriptional regulator
MALDPTAGAALATDADEGGGSQTLRAQLRLRELIVGGELEPGARIPELALVERLGVSRTPVRAALVRLAEEGLLEALPGGGFAVRDFGETDIYDAIELRGTLEGLAARLAAERGVGALLMAQWRDCVARIDELLAPPALSEAAFSAYVGHNARFHQLLAEAAGSALVKRQIERVVTLPFASPNGFVMLRATGERARDSLVVAQQQHRAVLEAIDQREGARAEALMREHARIAHANLREALRSQQGLLRLPGARLIRHAAR